MGHPLYSLLPPMVHYTREFPRNSRSNGECVTLSKRDSKAIMKHYKFVLWRYINHKWESICQVDNQSAVCTINEKILPIGKEPHKRLEIIKRNK